MYSALLCSACQVGGSLSGAGEDSWSQTLRICREQLNWIQLRLALGHREYHPAPI
jgi:hypothetical protein